MEVFILICNHISSEAVNLPTATKTDTISLELISMPQYLHTTPIMETLTLLAVQDKHF